MREIVSPLDGFGSPFGTRSRPQIITALIRPALAPIVSGQTVEDALSADVDQTSNYASTVGTIATVQVDILVNGETPAALDIPLDAGDTIALSVTVTDSEANVRVFTASRVVGAVAPTNDVAPSIAGDTALGDVLTVTAGDWSGDPAPTLSYQWRRDGAAITGETGTTYTITIADSGADITVLETATNSAGSASQASNAITADTFTVPDAFTAPDWGVANDDGDISVNILTLPDDGGAPITDLEYRVNGGAAVSFGETTTGSYPIVADEDDEVEIRAVNAVDPGDWSDVKLVPADAFDPATLFAAGEEGAWFEPSPTTCFTDTARTTPASVGQAVAGMTDLSGRGNHATQAITSARPILRQAGTGEFYLEFDGIDDAFATSAIDFTSTDEMSLFAGVRKLSKQGFVVIAEFSISSVTTNGAFLLGSSISSQDDYGYRSRGSATATATSAGGFSTPLASVFTGLSKISNDSAILRRNAVQIASSALDQGTGNYGNHALYIGGREATSLFFRGDLYGLIVRGALSDATEIQNTEEYLFTKTPGVTLP